MSEISQGEGWWLASDGKWYPAEQHPSHQPSHFSSAGGPGVVSALPPAKSKRRKRAALVLIGILILLVIAILVAWWGSTDKSTTDGSPNLIENGGFESPKVPKGSYVLFGGGQSFTGWKVVGTGNLAVISGSYTSEGLKFPSLIGQQWLDLTGLSNSAVGVSQEIATVAGQTYTLRFAVGNQDDPSGIYGARSTVDVFADGRRLVAATNATDNGSKTQVWRTFTRQFTATREFTTIRFTNADPSNDNTNGLDDVSVHSING